MEELVWINGRICPAAQATVSAEDRGFVFADGVYEVIRVYNGRPFTLEPHLRRLGRSAQGISLDLAMTSDTLARQAQDLVARSGMNDGMIYLQVTRGAGPRNHVFTSGMKPTVMMLTRELTPVPAPGSADGVKLLTVEDERWKRCWIKSIALLPNVLAKNQAISAGYDEAIMIDAGNVTECSTSNICGIINGKLVTHPVGTKVLPGITREVLLPIARQLGIVVEERPWTTQEMMQADELFITSTTRELSWVASVDGTLIKPGHCGELTLKLHRAYQDQVKRECGGIAAA